MRVITGPSGNVGRELVTLLSTGEDRTACRLACRHPERLALPTSDRAAVEATQLDFFDRATWAAALDGVESLFLLFPLPSNRAARQAIIPFLDAAERSGCTHVVYVSVIGAERAAVIPHHHVEQALQAHSMRWTILRCGFFMQNLHRTLSTHGFDIAERGEVFVPAGAGRTTFLDARDAAAVAAAALTHPDGHLDRIYHLTGSQALTMAEVAQLLSIALREPIRYTHPGLIRFAARLRRRGLGWDTIGFMAAVYTLTRLGYNQAVTDDVERILGRPPRTLGAFLHDTAWRWHQRSWT